MSLVRVCLHGPIAEKFGAEHLFNIRTPREAAAALEANFPGFATAFREHERWAIVADGSYRDGDEAAVSPVSRELHFYPQVEGNAFLGAMAVGWLFPGLGTVATQILGGLLVAGVAFGLSMLLRPKKPEQEAEKPKIESYAFTGPENVTAQGVAVPLIYGRVFCGSVVVSAGLSVSDEIVAE